MDVVVPAARQSPAQPRGNALGQALELRQVLRQPHRQAAIVQRFGAARAALGARQAGCIVMAATLVKRGIGRRSAGARGLARTAGQRVLQLLHHLAQVA